MPSEAAMWRKPLASRLRKTQMQNRFSPQRPYKDIFILFPNTARYQYFFRLSKIIQNLIFKRGLCNGQNPIHPDIPRNSIILEINFF